MINSSVLKTSRRCLSALLGIATVSIGVQADASFRSRMTPKETKPTATIDLNTQKYLSDESELAREKFFNIHGSYSTSDLTAADHEFLSDELNVGFGRSFWSPFSAYNGIAPYPTEEEAATAGAAAVAAHMDSKGYQYRDHRMVVTDHPRNVYEEGEDPAVAAQWAVDYFRHYYGDDYRPIFYEPMNEPFVHAHEWVEGPWDGEANQVVKEGMTAWFREIGKAFHEAEMPVNVIGYSSAWPSMELWDFGHWESNMKMFMDDAGPYMDAISVHLYDGVNVTGQDNFRSGSNAMAILDLVETYSNFKWDYTKPHALTEYGGISAGWPAEYSPEKSASDMNSLNHLLFGFLERQDRILTSIPFVTDKSAWYYRNNDFNPYNPALWRPDPDSIVGTKVNNFLLTEKAKFFQLWSKVRGNRAQVSSNDPDLKAHVFVYGPYAYVCLNNLETAEKTVDLNFVSGLDAVIGVEAKRLSIPQFEGATLSEESYDVPPTSITLAAQETVILTYDFGTPIEFGKQVHKRNYYSDNHVAPIVAKEKMRYEFTDVELTQRLSLADVIAAFRNSRGAATWFGRFITPALEVMKSLRENAEKHKGLVASLRVSIARDHDLSKMPIVRMNGHKLKVPSDWAGYDQANRDQFFGTIEVPVPVGYIKGHNRVSVRFPDDGGRVSSVVLAVDEARDYSPVAVTGISLPETFELNKDKPKKIYATVAPHDATDKYVTWESSDETVAVVSEDGTIVPLMPGEVTITATTNDGGFIASSVVTVQDRLSIPDQVTILTDLSDVIASDSYFIDVQYSASTDRDVAVEMRVDGIWKGIKQVPVPAGTGTVTVHLTFPEPLPPGVGTWISSIRPTGGDWRTSLDGHSFYNTIIREDPTLVDVFDIVSNLDALPSSERLAVDLEYKVAEPRNVRIDLWSPWTPETPAGWLAWGSARLEPGDGVATITMSNTTPPSAGSPYQFRTVIKADDGTEILNKTFYATITEPLPELPAVDEIKLNTDMSNIPSTSNIELEFVYNFEETRKIVVHLWSPWTPETPAGWLAHGSATVAPGQGLQTVRIGNADAPPPGAAYQFRVSFQDAGGTVVVPQTIVYGTLVEPAP
ncbi:Ig-like domain-containing protein [Pelagicoccus mobilis]|uniref:Ig-like domain-containing protein n=1 Tax=Pelagicoccus mobilis TaxID=415221 RepID=A0A934S2L9_9BACT|nr:Ig-like domain-containing protein [Pelagicoccus mobilis]MBK1878697.1 Ig-like domain-containing protein [Pelagicoccus mobilis]